MKCSVEKRTWLVDRIFCDCSILSDQEALEFQVAPGHVKMLLLVPETPY